MKEAIGIIILAAGASSRMGQPKQLLFFGGQSLIRRVAGSALATECRPVIVVLGANEDTVLAEIKDLKLEIVVNKDWPRGMGSSLAVGMKQLLLLSPEVTSVLILLSDQPFINEEVITKIVSKFKASGRKIVAAYYKETTGVPAIFDKLFFEKILQLKGDQGAKKIINAHMDVVELLDIPEAALDIDTPQDLETVLAHWKTTLQPPKS